MTTSLTLIPKLNPTDKVSWISKKVKKILRPTREPAFKGLGFRDNIPARTSKSVMTNVPDIVD